MNLRLSTLATLALLLPLSACSDEPDAPPIELLELDCGRVECDSGAPLVAGGRMIVQPAELGVVTSIVARAPGLASVALEPGTTDETWIVSALRPGTTQLELRDDAGRVVGEHTIEIAAVDHLEASITWFIQGRAFQAQNLRSGQPHYIGQPVRLRVVVDAYAGAVRLRGEPTYQVELTLPAESVELENDPSGNVFIDAARGDNTFSFRLGDHTEAFHFVIL